LTRTEPPSQAIGAAVLFSCNRATTLTFFHVAARQR